MSIRRRPLLPFSITACLLVLASASSHAQPSPPVPPLPGAASASSPAAPALAPLDQAQRGVVSIERAGRVLGLGFVLGGDGRILTVLSLLGDGNGIDARYADGSIVNVRVGHSDRGWDLALLVPQIGRWEHGLRASNSDPLAKGSQVRTFAKRARAVRVASVLLQGRTEVVGGDGEILRDALHIGSRIPDSDLGAPLVDEEGRVIGMVSRACKLAEGEDAKNCKRVAYGAPIGAVRQFLRAAPANAIPPTPWLGIQGVTDQGPIARGVKVVRVHPGSPAGEAGLHDASAGGSADVIVAVDGSPVQTPEKLASLVRDLAVGQQVEVIFLRDGKFRAVSVKLSAAPTRPHSSEPARP